MRDRQSGFGRPTRRDRGATTIVESTVVLAVLLVFLFGVLDLGLCILRYNTLSEGARRIAREAIVRGAEAPPERSSWGPVTYVGTAADGSEYADALGPVAAALDRGAVHIRLEWPDADNEPDDRVRVELRQTYHPITPLVLGTGGIEISATTTMRVVH